MEHSKLFTIWQVVGICVTLIVTITTLFSAGGWWLRDRFAKLEKSITSAKQEIDFAIQSIKIWLGSLLIQLRGKMDENALVDLTQRLGFKVKATGNPISQDQANTINRYVDMVKTKTHFTPEQASEFKMLVETYASDPDVRRDVGRDKLDTLLMIAGTVFARYYLMINTEK